MDVLKLELPYPPSVNHYYTRTSTGLAIGAKGKAYREEVFYLLHKSRNFFSKEHRLTVTVYVFPPDKKKRDIDNLSKCLLDSLQFAHVFPDDNQIDKLCLVRCDPVAGGKLIVWVNEC